MTPDSLENCHKFEFFRTKKKKDPGGSGKAPEKLQGSYLEKWSFFVKVPTFIKFYFKLIFLQGTYFTKFCSIFLDSR